MKPGRELDKLIAEKVFGEQFLPFADWAKTNKLDISNIELGNYAELEHFQLLHQEAEDSWMSSLPQFSTDISAAWQVVEKLENDGFYYIVSNDLKGVLSRSTWASFGKFGELIIKAKGETVPEAICLAALKVVAVRS